MVKTPKEFISGTPEVLRGRKVAENDQKLFFEGEKKGNFGSENFRKFQKSLKVGTKMSLSVKMANESIFDTPKAFGGRNRPEM